MAATTSTKRSRVKIGTHSGQFHVDEAFACWMLRQLPEYRDAEIIRTRDSAVLSELDVLVDVGAEYDASRFRFDHHQRTFVDVFGEGHNIRLSSAGLIYKHFGRRVVARLAGWDDEASEENRHLSSEERARRTEVAWLRLYESFVKCLDGIDNGVSQYDSTSPPLYRNNTDLASRVGRLNPPWYASQSAQDADDRFREAMELAGSEFQGALRDFCSDWFQARDIVQAACKASRALLGGATEVLVLERPCPWKEHLFEFEKEHQVEGQFKYVLYPDASGPSWRIQAVPAALGAFGDRLSLPEPWRGVRDQELSDLLGIPGCIFVHASGFIGGAGSKEAVVEMAKRALTFAK